MGDVFTGSGGPRSWVELSRELTVLAERTNVHAGRVGIHSEDQRATFMVSYEKTLTQPPDGKRELELWMQHAAGLILFEDVRNYAIEQLDSNLSTDARVAALKAIDDAVYGMMMVIDGVSGALQSEKHRVSLAVTVQLTDLETEETTAEINLAEGDGMCMGFHGWRDGDFGKYPPMEQ